MGHPSRRCEVAKCTVSKNGGSGGVTANALLAVLWPGLLGEHADHVVLKGVTDMPIIGSLSEAVV